MLTSFLKSSLFILLLVAIPPLFAEDSHSEKAAQTHLYLLLDDSGSMKSPAFAKEVEHPLPQKDASAHVLEEEAFSPSTPSRRDKMVEGLNALFDRLSKLNQFSSLTKVHIITMNNVERSFEVSTTKDFENIKRYIAKLRTDGSTNLSKPIERAAEIIKKNPAPDSIVLFEFTDGDSSDDPVLTLWNQVFAEPLGTRILSDVHFFFIGVTPDTSRTDLIDGFNTLNDKYLAANGETGIKKQAHAALTPTFAGFEKMLSTVTASIVASGIRRRLMQVQQDQTQIAISKTQIQNHLNFVRNKKQRLVSLNDSLKLKTTEISQSLEAAHQDILDGNQLNAEKAYLALLEQIKGFGFNHLNQQLKRFNQLLSEVESEQGKFTRLKDQIDTYYLNFTNLLKAIQDIKSDPNFKISDYPKGIHNWLNQIPTESEQEFEGVQKSFETLTSEIGDLVKELKQSRSSHIKDFQNVRGLKINEFKVAFIKQFGKDAWTKLTRKAAMQLKTYFDPIRGELVWEGFRVIGGGSGGSSFEKNSHKSSLVVRNKGTVVVLPGSGKGGGSAISKLINEGQIVVVGGNKHGGGGSSTDQMTLFTQEGQGITISLRHAQQVNGIHLIPAPQYGGFFAIKLDGNLITQLAFLSPEQLEQLRKEFLSPKGKTPISDELTQQGLSEVVEAFKLTIFDTQEEGLLTRLIQNSNLSKITNGAGGVFEVILSLVALRHLIKDKVRYREFRIFQQREDQLNRFDSDREPSQLSPREERAFGRFRKFNSCKKALHSLYYRRIIAGVPSFYLAIDGVLRNYRLFSDQAMSWSPLAQEAGFASQQGYYWYHNDNKMLDEVSENRRKALLPVDKETSKAHNKIDGISKEKLEALLRKLEL